MIIRKTLRHIYVFLVGGLIAGTMTSCMNGELTWQLMSTSDKTDTKSSGGTVGGAISQSPFSFVLGQLDFSSVKSLVRGQKDSEGISTDGTRLFVADVGNHRVLIWNTIPTSSQTPPDLVLGQPDLSSDAPNFGGISAKSLQGPESVFSDGTRLFVADTGNHRVLIWNSIPTFNYAAADLVLGQPDMTSNLSNNGGLSAQTFSFPRSVHVEGSRLVVADSSNNRVLIWNSIPNVNQQAANVVVGQPDLISYIAGLTATKLDTPTSVSGCGGKLLVADSANHRILIWNTMPSTNGATADVVLGQSSFSSKAVNSGGLSGKSLNNPTGVSCDGSRIYVSDYYNHRVLIWGTTSPSTFSSSSFVVGQPSMTSNTGNSGGRSAQSLMQPFSVFGGAGKLFVGDYGNKRSMIWNSVPTADFVASDVILGQPDAFSGAPNFAGVSASILNVPRTFVQMGGKYFVADTQNSRILIWNSEPATIDTPADLVVGQPSFTASGIGITAQNMNTPFSIHSCGGKLLVADSGSNRVLIWNAIPTSNFAAADVVLGQPNMTSNAFNNGGIGTGLGNPNGIYCDGSRLFVADTLNHRVLIWNTIPTVTGTLPNVVVGQPNMTSNSINAGGGPSTPSSVSLYNPNSVYSDGVRLFVADSSNHRVLIWNSIPTTDYTAADLVLGQPSFTSNFANNGGLPTNGAKSFWFPYSVHGDGQRIFVADKNNHRVLYWNSIPAINRQPADGVLGQPDFTVNGPGVLDRFKEPTGVFIDSHYVYVADSMNNRSLRFLLP